MRYSPKLIHSTAKAMPWVWALVGGALGLAIAAVWLAPAQWLATRLNRATSGHMQLIESRGTIWNGSGTLLLSGGTGSRDSIALPGRLNWKLRVQAHAIGIELHADCCTPQALHAQILPRWRGFSIQIADRTSEWPAAVLAGLGAPWNTLRLGGSLQLKTQRLTFDWPDQAIKVDGQMALTAVALTSRVSTLKPLGTYQLSMASGSNNEFKLDTLEGGLQMRGTGRWVRSRVTFEGVASAAPGYEVELANLLNLIGRRSGPDSVINLG